LLQVRSGANAWAENSRANLGQLGYDLEIARIPLFACRRSEAQDLSPTTVKFEKFVALGNAILQAILDSCTKISNS
jgi:hypothetical protein